MLNWNSSHWRKLAVAIVVVFAISFFWNRDYFDGPIDEPRSPESQSTRSESIDSSSSRIESPIAMEDIQNRKMAGASTFDDNAHEPEIDDIALEEMYEKYVDRANDGDLDSVAVLVSVLGECRNLENPVEKFEELRRSDLPQDMLALELARHERCSALISILPDLDTEFLERTDELRAARHPLLMVKRRLPEADEKRPLLIQAILGDYPEPHLYARAFMEAGSFHYEYPEYVDKHREEAWFLLSCEASLTCDSNAQRQELRTKKYLEHEYLEIEKIEASLRSAIRQRDAEALGFNMY